MKKSQISIIIASLFALILLSYLGAKLYKVDYNRMVVRESDFILYSEKDTEFMKSLKSYIEGKEDKKNKKLAKTLYDVNTYLDRFFILGLSSYGIDYRPIDEQNLLVVLDFGDKYPLLKFKISKYFKKQGAYYRLKDDYKEELIEKQVIDEDIDIYMMAHRGYYVVSLNTETLGKYKEELRKNTVNNYFTNNLTRKNMYMIDFKKFFGEETIIGDNSLRYLRGYVDYDSTSQEFELNNAITFDGAPLDSFFQPSKEKLIDYYIEEGEGVYFSNESLSDIIFLLFVYNVELNQSKEAFQNLNWSALTDRVGTEAYLNLENKTAALSLKDANFFNFMLSLLFKKDTDGSYIISDEYKVYIIENILFVNKVLERDKQHKSNAEDLIIANLNINTIFDILNIEHITDEECTLEITGKNIDNEFRLNIKFSTCFYKELIKGIETIN